MATHKQIEATRKAGLTLDALRDLVAEADRLGLPGDTLVRGNQTFRNYINRITLTDTNRVPPVTEEATSADHH